MDIEKWRLQINQIDQELIRLLNQRADLARKIGQQKEKDGLPVYVPEREKFVLARIVEQNPGPIDESGMRKIFEQIMDVCRQIQ